MMCLTHPTSHKTTSRADDLSLLDQRTAGATRKTSSDPRKGVSRAVIEPLTVSLNPQADRQRRLLDLR